MRPVPTALLVAAATFVLVTRSPRALQAQPVEMSPEEAALQLKPYILSAANVPAGYRADTAQVDTAVSVAFNDISGLSPNDALALLDNEGLVLRSSQQVLLLGNSTIDSAPPAATFTLSLMRSVDQAQAVLDDQSLQVPARGVDLRQLAVPSPLGDGNALYAVGSASRPLLDDRWRRGSLVFELSTFSTNGDPTGLLNLAAALDTAEAGNPPIDLSGSRVTPPANDADRLQTLLRLATIQPAADAIPSGLVSFGPQVLTSAGMVANAAQPALELQLLDQKWQRLIALGESLTSPSSATRYWFSVSEDATPEAAAIDMRDFSPNPQPLLEPSPVALGDDAFLRHTQIVVAGAIRDSTEIVWRHGTVGLLVQISDLPGKVADDDVVAFAEAADVAYLQSAYATS